MAFSDSDNDFPNLPSGFVLHGKASIVVVFDPLLVVGSDRKMLWEILGSSVRDLTFLASFSSDR